jgi:hypothetical protein
MYAVAEELEISFKATGEVVEVANNDYALLSYYLNCVSKCVPDLIEDRLTKHTNYHYFTEQTKTEIVVYAALLTPALLEGKAFKKCTIKEMEALSPGYGNEFFQLTERARLGILGVEQDAAILIESKRVQVTKLMVYKQSWLDSNYIRPLERILSGGRSAPAPKPRSLPAPSYKPAYKPSNYEPPSYQQFQEEDSWNTLIRIFLLTMMFSIVGLCGLCLCSSGKWSRAKMRAALLGFVFSLFCYIYLVNHGILFSSSTTSSFLSS